MGDLIKIPHSELNATVEVLDHQGVTQKDFEVLRKASSWSQSIVGRIHKTDSYLWAMLEMEQVAKQAGFLENDFRALAKDEDKLRQVLTFLRVSGIGPVQQNTIDCDAVPFIPNGLWIEEKDQLPGRVRGQFVFNNKVKLYLSPNQQDGKITKGIELVKELTNEPTLPANVLDYWLKNPNLIPDELKKDEKGNILYTFFWGTIYRGSYDYLCVRCLYFGDGRWRSGYYWLGVGWSGSHPAALRAS